MGITMTRDGRKVCYNFGHFNASQINVHGRVTEAKPTEIKPIEDTGPVPRPWGDGTKALAPSLRWCIINTNTSGE